jgi:hypothetical protein
MEDVKNHYHDGYRFGERDGLLEAAHIISDFINNLIQQDRTTLTIDELLELADQFPYNKEEETDD